MCNIVRQKLANLRIIFYKEYNKCDVTEQSASWDTCDRASSPHRNRPLIPNSVHEDSCINAFNSLCTLIPFARLLSNLLTKNILFYKQSNVFICPENCRKLTFCR